MPRPKPRGIMLTEQEQAALLWLLSASDNGQIISGSELPKVMQLSNIHKRIRAKLASWTPTPE